MNTGNINPIFKAAIGGFFQNKIYMAFFLAAILILGNCTKGEIRGIKGCRLNCDGLYHQCVDSCRISNLPEGLEGAPQKNVARWDSLQCITRCDKNHERCLNDCENYKSYTLEE